MAKVLAVVVSYHPEADIAVNIEALLKQVDHVLIVDNETSSESQAILKGLSSENVSFIWNEKNLGVATGFNQGIRWALERQYEFYLLMDQDSRPEAGMVKELCRVSQSFLERNEIALVGPRHEDYERKVPQTSLSPIQEFPLLISSGSLISKKLVDNVGLYDEQLFIDHVDHDYSLRVAAFGGRCVKVNTAVLLHRFGNAKVKTFLGKSFFLQEYSPFRRYFMMRNRIVLYKRYGMFKGEWFWIDARNAIKDLVKLLFFESNKVSKLKATSRGLVGGIFWSDKRK